MRCDDYILLYRQGKEQANRQHVTVVPEMERIRTSWPVLGYIMSSGSSRTAYNIP